MQTLGNAVLLAVAGMPQGAAGRDQTLVDRHRLSIDQAFLNRLLAIGISQTRPTGAVHEIEELL